MAAGTERQIDKLVAKYSAVLGGFVEVLRQKPNLSNLLAYKSQLINILSKQNIQLNSVANRITNTLIPKAYEEGVKKSKKTLDKSSVKMKEFTKESIKAEEIRLDLLTKQTVKKHVGEVSAMVDDTRMQLYGLNHNIISDIKRAINDVYSRLKEHEATEIARIEALQINILKRIEAIERQKSDFLRKIGVRVRRIAKTSSAGAQNRAAVIEALEAGSDLVKMSFKTRTCKLCRKYQGRTYSISGKSKHYPSLYDTAFSSGYNVLHPNCEHKLTPVVKKIKPGQSGDDDIQTSLIPMLDEKIAKAKAYYDNLEKQKKRTREDRLDWENFKAKLGKKLVPKSFSAFRELKASQSKKWSDLKTVYNLLGYGDEGLYYLLAKYYKANDGFFSQDGIDSEEEDEYNKELLALLGIKASDLKDELGFVPDLSDEFFLKSDSELIAKVLELVGKKKKDIDDDKTIKIITASLLGTANQSRPRGQTMSMSKVDGKIEEFVKKLSPVEKQALLDAEKMGRTDKVLERIVSRRSSSRKLKWIEMQKLIDEDKGRNKKEKTLADYIREVERNKPWLNKKQIMDEVIKLYGKKPITKKDKEELEEEWESFGYSLVDRDKYIEDQQKESLWDGFYNNFIKNTDLQEPVETLYGNAMAKWESLVDIAQDKYEEAQDTLDELKHGAQTTYGIFENKVQALYKSEYEIVVEECIQLEKENEILLNEVNRLDEKLREASKKFYTLSALPFFSVVVKLIIILGGNILTIIAAIVMTDVLDLATMILDIEEIVYRYNEMKEVMDEYDTAWADFMRSRRKEIKAQYWREFYKKRLIE